MHINILHLLWIVPLSIYFGFGICAILTMAKKGDKYLETHSGEK